MSTLVIKGIHLLVLSIKCILIAGKDIKYTREKKIKLCFFLKFLKKFEPFVRQQLSLFFHMTITTETQKMIGLLQGHSYSVNHPDTF